MTPTDQVTLFRTALRRIVEKGDECRRCCGLGYAIGNCGCASGCGRIADEALEAAPESMAMRLKRESHESRNPTPEAVALLRSDLHDARESQARAEKRTAELEAAHGGLVLRAAEAETLRGLLRRIVSARGRGINATIAEAGRYLARNANAEFLR